MGHGDGSKRDFQRVAWLHEKVRVPPGNIRVAMVKTVSLPKVGKGNHAGKQSEAAPEIVLILVGTEGSIHGLVRHYAAQEH